MTDTTGTAPSKKSDPNKTIISTAVEQVSSPSSKLMVFDEKNPLRLDSGKELSPWQIAYETYGELNADKSNAVLVCHALTGDQYVASQNPVTGKPGWWQLMVGPERPVDTNHYFVICANVLGGCLGTTGPASINPRSGEQYATDLPIVTIGDMVRSQAKLVEALGIETLFAVIGGSMGGMQVLQWAVAYPERVFAAIPIATGARHSSQNIAFHEVGRQAVMADPEWCSGQYAKHGKRPSKGLAVARMAAHITYMSDESLQDKFGRNLQDRPAFTFGFDADFQIESYLRHQGMTFVDRFDANSYLYVTRAMDYFDLAAAHGGLLANAFKGTKTRFCVMSFTTDWLFPTSESKSIVQALNAAAANVSFVEVDSSRGHDAFLLNEPEMFKTIYGFLTGSAKARGIPAPASHNPSAG
ncbi:homoserine O-acetyltransferase MetX [Flexibacterium corallicola]|uniref:homoserine O-acetyltransferase MetX n=1 Tax=Flexibacterium corallicola TaxID=3037259 RepID=UPI00286F28F6|nr:homoserine O-acetyltransferase [Pseudovibrio sp. M1P-2-3]